MGIGEEVIGLSSLNNNSTNRNHKKRYCEDNVMWGFGLYLMRLADYLAGRSRRKRERTSKTDRHLTTTKECQICGKDFLEDTLDDHIKEKHSDML